MIVTLTPSPRSQGIPRSVTEPPDRHLQVSLMRVRVGSMRTWPFT